MDADTSTGHALMDAKLAIGNSKNFGTDAEEYIEYIKLLGENEIRYQRKYLEICEYSPTASTILAFLPNVVPLMPTGLIMGSLHPFSRLSSSSGLPTKNVLAGRVTFKYSLLVYVNSRFNVFGWMST